MKIIVLLSLWLIFFSTVIFSGEVFYCCDNLLINIPAKVFLAEQLQQGRFPLWNPYLFSGTPFLADINLSLLYPTSLLYLFLTPFQALTASIIISFLMGLLGSYWCFKKLNLSNFSAVGGSIVFGFSGAMVVYTGNVPMIQVASLLPWVFGAWVLFVERQSRRRFVLLSCLSALQIIAGHPQLTFYSFLFCLSYAMFFLPGTFWQRIKRLMPVGLLIGMISSIQLLPFIELALHSTRIGLGFDYASFGALPVTALIRFIIPSMVGNASVGTEWWQGGSVYGYIGVLSFVLIAVGARKEKLWLFFLSAAIISLLAAFGKNTPVFWLLYYLVPGISLFRVPSHFLLLTTFASAVLVAYGLDAFAKKRIPQVPYHQLAFMLLLIGAGITVFYSQLAESITPFVARYLPTKFALFSASGVQQLVRAIGTNTLFIGCSLDIFFLIKRMNKGFVVLLALLFVDLFLYSRMNLLTVSQIQTNQWLATIQQQAQVLKSQLSSSNRLLIDPQVYPSKTPRQFGIQTYLSETTWQTEILRPNLAMIHHLHLVDGYASIIYGPYQQFFDQSAKDPTGLTVGLIPNKKLDLAANSTIIVPSQSKPFAITENISARSIVSFSMDNGLFETVPFDDSSPNQRIISYTATAAGRLILAETNYPGWRAFVNGQLVETESDQQIFQSVRLAPGHHAITFQFFPQSVIVGTIVTLLGIGICVLLLVAPQIQHNHQTVKS